MVWRFFCLLGFFSGLSDVGIVTLTPETLQGFDNYVKTAEARLDRQAASRQFLWSDGVKGAAQKLQHGQVLAEPWVGEGDIGIPGGLIHDWVGAVFISAARMDAVIRMVEDYDRAKVSYKPDVMDSKLLSHTDDDFTVSMRLLKKNVLTVVLNTVHEVHYTRVSDTRWYSRSRSTRMAEVVNPGEPGERELAPGKDHGFLWRLNSYWRFEERDGGVYVECEAISLSRGVPVGLGWMINPIIRTLPRQSLTNTLRFTRDAFKPAR
jgi:hypothetical protein